MHTAVEFLSIDEAAALLTMVDPPSGDGSCRRSGQCQALPYSVIDPTVGAAERQMKYLLNQARFRAGEVLTRLLRIDRLYPAQTMLRLSSGPLQARADAAPVDWWSLVKLLVPIDIEGEVTTASGTVAVASRSLVVVPCDGTSVSWEFTPKESRQWLAITMSFTDQMDWCEL